MKALHALCPAPERLVEYVLDGPTDEITTHIEDCAECSREVIDIFKRFDQFNALERKGEGDTLPTGLWESLHAEHKTPRPPVVLSLRLHPKLSDELLNSLALHIIGVTVLSVLFVVVGAGIRLGGLF